ncbi:MAG: type 2 isopentenyl-diphosphate Delta-isomerase [Candidatus Micrarchaeota archaeon]
MAIENRKGEHVEIALNRSIESRRRTTGFESMHFTHYSLPENDFDEINMRCSFLKHSLAAPFMIVSMTGGFEAAGKINKDLAAAAEKEGIVFALGSQRAMLEKPELKKTFQVRDVAPKVFLCGNIGAVQLQDYPQNKLEGLVSTIDADALCIHLNPLQEVIQKGGDKKWKGVLKQIEKAVDFLGVPVIVKEVGEGINFEAAKELEKAGVAAIDVAGVGGTSWSAIELHRKGAEAGETFWDWGNPTVQCLKECEGKIKVPLIASGGVRSGLDVAKSIRLGASLGGAGLPFIKAQNKGGAEGVRNEIRRWKHELQLAMFLTRSKTLSDLRKAKLHCGCCCCEE